MVEKTTQLEHAECRSHVRRQNLVHNTPRIWYLHTYVLLFWSHILPYTWLLYFFSSQFYTWIFHFRYILFSSSGVSLFPLLSHVAIFFFPIFNYIEIRKNLLTCLYINQYEKGTVEMELKSNIGEAILIKIYNRG